MQDDSRVLETSRKAGLSKLDLNLITGILTDFMNALSDDVYYDGRNGTIVIDAQPTIPAKNPLIVRDEKGKQRPCIRNITYGDPVCLLRLNYPAGKAKSMFFDSEKVASEAIDSLLEGKRLFYGHANASLNGNIYKTSGSDKTYESGHLMILNASFGRFLVGCGDSKADQDHLRECDFALVALARTLARMFPKDEELQASYDWIRTYGQIGYYHFELIVREIDELFNSNPKYIRDHEWTTLLGAARDDKPKEPILPFV